MQLLWINLLTDVFPGLALSAEPDVLSRPPREANAPIIRRSDYKRYASEALSISLGTLASYGYGLLRYGQGARASTLAFNTLVSSQLLHAYSCRSETHSVFSRNRLPPNRPLDLAVGAMSGLQLVAAFIPGLRGLLRMTSMGPVDFIVAGAGSIAPFIFNEMTKGSRKPAGHHEIAAQAGDTPGVK
jgi:Ca2+-transporting ATPase